MVRSGGTINKLIVGFDYTITGHAYKCSDCDDISEIVLNGKLEWEVSPDYNKKNYNDAQNYCFDLEIKNRTDWKLPTLEELESNFINPENVTLHPI